MSLATKSKRYSKAFYAALDAVAAMNGDKSAHDTSNRHKPILIGDAPGMVAEPTPLRWIARHHANGSDIDAYIRVNDAIAPIARTIPMRGVSARANAELIVRAVNGYEMFAPTIRDLLAALACCLACAGLSPAAKLKASAAGRRARRVIGEEW